MAKTVVADDEFFAKLTKAIEGEKPETTEVKTDEKTDDDASKTSTEKTDTTEETVTKAEFTELSGNVAKLLSLFAEDGLVTKALTGNREDIDTLKEAVSSALDRINGVEQAPAVRKSVTGQEVNEPIKKSASQSMDDAFRHLAAHPGSRLNLR
jgi:hypothetical protein